MNINRISLLLGLVAMASAMTAQTVLSDADLVNAYSQRSYDHRISCHDPSIVYDNAETYYIYGSHLGHAKTTTALNYQSWDDSWGAYEVDGTSNSLFADLQGNRVNFSQAYNTHAITKVKNYQGKEVSFGNFDAHAWQYKGNNVQGMEWAPDVVYNKTMKKWCMYMSVNGDHWASSIVCLTSDNIEGPWIYQGPVVFSGFQGRYDHNGFTKTDDWKHTDLAIATGATTLPARYNTDKWGSFWPNCIDPCVFYDDDNNLWLSYGSWSGGIFLLKLDASTGLRDYTYTYDYEVNGTKTTPGSANANCTSDPYFGKKIAGGYYVSGEASYIRKFGSHWFLFVTYGGLTSNGGYQMRVFRADNPTGPYKDAYGTSAIYSGYRLNYGATANDNRGVLLFSNYQWDTMPVAELAQGHNSAFTDQQGRDFVVNHTRFNDGTEGHQVRVHQLFLNDEGWLMAAPFEFAGETATNASIASGASIADSDMPGDYQFIRHQYNQNAANKSYEKPVSVTLTADGIVSGDLEGSWSRTAGTDYIHLTIGGVVYTGVLTKETIDYTDISAVCISALSSSSGSLAIGQNTFTYQQEIWGVKADAKAAIKYTLDHLQIPLSDGATINASQTLPSAGKLGAKVTWTSSDPSVMTNEGVVKGNGSVVLTCTIDKDNYSYTKGYKLVVDKNATATEPVYYPESSVKNTSSGWWTNFSKADYTLAKGAKAKFEFYNYSNESANYCNWCLYGASTTHGEANYTEYFGIRCDNWDNTTSSNTGCTSNYNWDTFKADMNGSHVSMEVDYSQTGVFTMTSTITTTSGKSYSYSYTKTLSSAPSTLTLFFVNEGSYIDGSSLTGIEKIVVNSRKNCPYSYNLSGQRVSKNYRGVVIRNGKKVLQK
jgi:arabinan endo-1,5-alpha-L-arabinosidase